MRTKNTLRLLFCAIFVAALPLACGGEQSAPGTTAPQPKAESKAPLVQKPAVTDWCKEHGVPESVCTRCNASLIAAFQKKGDWCKEHSLPESQCIECHPELKAKFEAMAPKAGG